MKRLIPDTIASRTLIVLIAGLAVSHAISVALYFTDRGDALTLGGDEHTGERIATIERMVERATQDERTRIVKLADERDMHVVWAGQSALEEEEADGQIEDDSREAQVDHLKAEGERAYRLRYVETVTSPFWLEHFQEKPQEAVLGQALLVSLQLSDRSWLNFAAPIEPPETFWSLRFALSLAVMLLAVVLLSALVVHHLTKPLATFARAAQRLGIDVKAPPLPETGPTEVRQVARAFNEMQERIRRFVEDRTQMIAAISHDLGTPITRLRLRAEFIDDEEQRGKMLADLDDMEKMVTSSLSFMRDEAAGESRVMVDLKTLLQRVCDDLADIGQAVTLEVSASVLPYNCQPVALRRALTNLVENAVRYGDRAQVSLHHDSEGLVIRIDDDGPGIAEELREAVFKPFSRLETSRSRETGGTGLGMTVARTIIRAHGGDVVLVNRKEGGLRVEVNLPQ